MAESVSTSRYYCHQCSTDINPNDDFTCPTCSTGFIELMDERFEEEQFQDTVATSMNSVLSHLLPMLRHGAPNDPDMQELDGSQPMRYRIRQRRRPEESQDTSEPQSSGVGVSRIERQPSQATDPQPSQSGSMANEDHNLQSPAGLDSLVQQLINNLLGNTAGFTSPESLFFHGNPGDYVFGQSAFDNIVTQLMNQLEPTGPPPASEQQIRTLKTVPVTKQQLDENLQCSICLELFEPADCIIQLPCAHSYHDPCIKPWLKKHCTCPICRKTLNGEEPCNPDGRPDNNRPSIFDLHRQ